MLLWESSAVTIKLNGEPDVAVAGADIFKVYLIDFDAGRGGPPRPTFKRYVSRDIVLGRGCKPEPPKILSPAQTGENFKLLAKSVRGGVSRRPEKIPSSGNPTFSG